MTKIYPDDDEATQAAYRELFRYELDPGIAVEICVATNGNFALGSPRFQAQIAAVLGRRVTPGKARRPRNQNKAELLDLFDGR